jgi:hypothetical protein
MRVREAKRKPGLREAHSTQGWRADDGLKVPPVISLDSCIFVEADTTLQRRHMGYDTYLEVGGQ